MIGVTLQLSHFECASCGVVFGLSQNLERNLRETHRNFFCPNGHTLSFRSKTEADLERDRRITAEKKLQEANADVAIARAEKAKAEAALNRTKKRVSAGVCPCCNRTFSQLRRHMAAKHPDFQAKK